MQEYLLLANSKKSIIVFYFSSYKYLQTSIADTGETTAAPAAAIVAFLIKSLLSISLVIVY